MVQEIPDTHSRLIDLTRAEQGGDIRRCSHCGGENRTDTTIHLKERQYVRFFSCTQCESEWWEWRNGEVVELADVLAEVDV